MKVWRPKPITSFRSRLAVLTAVAVALVIVAIAVVTYVGAERIVFQSIDNTLVKQSVNAIGRSETSGDPLVRNDFYGSIAWIVEAGGSAQGDPLPVTQEVRRVASSSGATYFTTINLHGIPEREIVMAVPSGLTVEGVNGPVPLPLGGALQLTTPLQEVDRELGLLRIGIVIAALVGVGAAVIIGLLVARRAMRPLDDLTESIERISTSVEDADRLSPESEDELGKLRRAFNRLLNAVDSSRATQRQLVLDASHELRTPITSLRTNIEVLPRVAELPEEDQRLIFQDMLSEVGELTNLVGNLTELVRGEQHPSPPVDFALSEVVMDAVRSVTPYGNTREVEIRAIVTTCLYSAIPTRLESPCRTSSAMRSSGHPLGASWRSPALTERSESGMRGRESPQKTSRTSSTGSTDRAQHGLFLARASGWPSLPRPSTLTEALSPQPTKLAAVRSSLSVFLFLSPHRHDQGFHQRHLTPVRRDGTD